MATSFIDIYAKTMTNIDSPILSRLQKTDLYSFCTTMNEYLADALVRYNPNKATASRVAIATASSVGTQSFIGDGVTTSFVLTSTPLASGDSIFKVWVGDNTTTDYSFDSATNAIVFTVAPSNQADILVDWYNDGAFGDLITPEDIVLLSLASALAWAYQTSNKLLDIDRSINDSGDFKQHAPGSTQDAKVNWVKHYEEMFNREMTKADWRPKFRSF